MSASVSPKILVDEGGAFLGGISTPGFSRGICLSGSFSLTLRVSARTVAAIDMVARCSVDQP